ncbi:Qat anti-phage system TatD family nuclease QatD [Bowmanella sp. JS7-9]|uniref:Qat anti-phage system TatD family nuclease QatD n=1 Tax=Pseudobowmanella zhangzhouensis TaxID=1537679 RepID=A0ABW1XIA3_9ALTE|nr:Qat anti-phage system TatD family nuclease QatD [Bowmanella sp. JS7-9]TBX27305.1 hydrolase TatD [Bowmanella sp. JS7-9]
MMDLHCHVDLYPDHSEVLNDLRECNYYVLSVTTVPSAWRGTVKLTEGIARCKTALGLHPQLAHLRKNELAIFDELVCETRYIGEIGLDGSKGYIPYIADQLYVFNHILEKCTQFNDKILSIHSLNATEQVLECLKAHPYAGIPILHWFLGTKKQVIEATEHGCFFSVGPAMLNSNRGLKVASWLPPDRVLLETDGPFAKVDNSPLLPSQAKLAIHELALLWKTSTENVVAQLKRNIVLLLNSGLA